MSRGSKRVDWYREWTPVSRVRAEARWKAALVANTWQPMSGTQCVSELRGRLNLLERAGILQPRQHERVREVELSEAAPADQRRLKEASHLKVIFAIGLSSPKTGTAQPLLDRHLVLSSGKRLTHGKLFLQAFIHENDRRPLGMNVMLRGRDPHRAHREFYIRYDLDAVPLGSSQVTHFSAHWHFGDDPDADDAETHDPRLPAPVLDPLAVLETLVETFFPGRPWRSPLGKAHRTISGSVERRHSGRADATPPSPPAA